LTVEVRCALRRDRGISDMLVADARWLMRIAGLARCELSLVIVGDRAMRTLNRRWRGRDRATDVLSFSQLEEPARPAGKGRIPPARLRRIALLDGAPLGDIVISLDTAARQARTMGISVAQRSRTLLIHGFLHILGYDHERSATEARRMFARERELARRLAASGSQSAQHAPRPR
jgi:probable rRNA maturation factor